MTSFGLLLAHLVGDYILQIDEMAKRKPKAADATWLGSLWCFAHCVTYALAFLMVAVAEGALAGMPFWFFLGVGALHYPVDRYRLAYKWMRVSGHAEFSAASNPLFPWSVILTDNVMHLAVAYVLWFGAAGQWEPAAAMVFCFGWPVVFHYGSGSQRAAGRDR